MYVIDYLKQYDIEDIYKNSEYDKYKIKVNENETMFIFIYKKINILAIMGNKERHFEKLKGFLLMEKVNLLDKKLFQNIFKENFSDNLCKIIIDIDVLGSEEELIEFQGCKLTELNLLEEYDFYDLESETKLKSYSIQPLGYKYIFKFSSINKLQINDRYDKNEIENLISRLIFLIKILRKDV